MTLNLSKSGLIYTMEDYHAVMRDIVGTKVKNSDEEEVGTITKSWMDGQDLKVEVEITDARLRAKLVPDISKLEIN